MSVQFTISAAVRDFCKILKNDPIILPPPPTKNYTTGKTVLLCLDSNVAISLNMKVSFKGAETITGLDNYVYLVILAW
ncbi:hypothetical protein XELAEV_18013575mg [Xenopus laevis]|uniref:Uncharacterized protein n=1 Tax=Xenopus laevis TaxID=8355 RepID=A0A974DRZ1_XENLA|nr:hypothetical protein XELAEV_18013575mg [Xenopus laevis]